jgi:hypothetical protein
MVKTNNKQISGTVKAGGLPGPLPTLIITTTVSFRMCILYTLVFVYVFVVVGFEFGSALLGHFMLLGFE